MIFQTYFKLWINSILISLKASVEFLLGISARTIETDGWNLTAAMDVKWKWIYRHFRECKTTKIPRTTFSTFKLNHVNAVWSMSHAVYPSLVYVPCSLSFFDQCPLQFFVLWSLFSAVYPFTATPHHALDLHLQNQLLLSRHFV